MLPFMEGEKKGAMIPYKYDWKVLKWIKIENTDRH